MLKKDNKDYSLSVRLPTGYVKLLDEIAIKESRSVSSVARAAIKEYLEKQGKLASA